MEGESPTLRILKTFHTIFTCVYIIITFFTIQCPYRRHWIPAGNIFTYFCSGLFFRITFTSVYSFNERLKISISNFRYWLKPNILVSLESITTPQKSLISHNFLWDSNLFCVLNEFKTTQTKKIPRFSDDIPLDNVDNFFTVR